MRIQGAVETFATRCHLYWYCVVLFMLNSCSTKIQKNMYSEKCFSPGSFSGS